MQKLLISVLLLPVLALAQEPVIVEKPIVCNWAKGVFENLTKDFKETPIWLGNTENSTRFSLFTNATGAWTIVQFDKDIACVIGTGNESQLLSIKSDL